MLIVSCISPIMQHMTDDITEPWIIEHPSGECSYYKYKGGPLHREDGPAMIFPSGSFSWYYEGQLHCLTGPAIRDIHNGWEAWYKHGKRHRTDGPAITRQSSYARWYVNGHLCITNEMFQRLANLSDSEMASIVLRYGPVS